MAVMTPPSLDPDVEARDTQLAAVAVLFAFALRVMSAGVYGASIGGGFMIMFGLPVGVTISTIAVLKLIRVCTLDPDLAATNRR